MDKHIHNALGLWRWHARKNFDRDEALKSALGVFRKKGFNATSTDDLRLAMGIGRQSFYDTFKGKKEIYLEALRKVQFGPRAWIFRDLSKVRLPPQGD